MKELDEFEKTLQAHLEKLAKSDRGIARNLKKPGKNITDCATYVIQQVRKTGRQGFADDEVYGLALHYYDEDSITVGSRPNTTVVVNHPLAAPVKTADKPASSPRPQSTGDKKSPKGGDSVTQGSFF